jgi:hypothetical protein
MPLSEAQNDMKPRFHALAWAGAAVSGWGGLGRDTQGQGGTGDPGAQGDGGTGGRGAEGQGGTGAGAQGPPPEAQGDGGIGGQGRKGTGAQGDGAVGLGAGRSAFTR